MQAQRQALSLRAAAPSMMPEQRSHDHAAVAARYRGAIPSSSSSAAASAPHWMSKGRRFDNHYGTRLRMRVSGQVRSHSSSVKVDFPEDLDLAFAAGLLSNGGLVQKPAAMATRPSPSTTTTVTTTKTVAAWAVASEHDGDSLQQAAHELATLYTAPPARRVEMARLQLPRGKPEAGIGGKVAGGKESGGASFRWRPGAGMMIGDGPSPPATVVGSSADDPADTSPPGFFNAAHVAQVAQVVPVIATAPVSHDRLGGNMPALLAAAAIQLEAAEADADIDYLRDFDRARRYL